MNTQTQKENPQLDTFTVNRWTVTVMRSGDPRRNSTSFPDLDADSIVAFHDNHYIKGFTPQGQFVSSYYLKTLLKARTEFGIRLDGGVEAWTVNSEDFARIVKILHALR